MGLNPKGRNWGDTVLWDSLAKFYAAFIIIWTVILYAGVIWMIVNRNLQSVKIRNVPVAVASVTFLHLYLVKIVLAYTTNGHFTCGAEFWIMSIYLPFGIALFQANLARLQSISEQQKKLLSSASSSSSGNSGISGVWTRWRELPQIKKTYTYIGLGMLIQLVITAVLYATTPELQGDWSSYPKGTTHAKGQALCRKSLVWIPSAFWQLLWSWVFGLYILFKVRNIRDTHYWRLGTWLSVVSGLPGTPLWLAAVFCVKFKPVNIRFVPPMWLAPGIITMEIVTVFFPIYEAFQSHRHAKTIAYSADKQEKHLSASLSSGPLSQNSSQTSFGISTHSKEIYSMASLEKALAVNPIPLLHFAAYQDFTAECIIFLMRVREWREAWTRAAREDGAEAIDEAARGRLFQLGVEIYMTCVLDTTSEFPINIESTVRKELDLQFEHAVPEGKKRTSEESGNGLIDFDAGFDDNDAVQAEVKRITMAREESDNSVGTLWSRKSEMSSSIEKPSVTTTATAILDQPPTFSTHPAVRPLGVARAQVPSTFDNTVFDAAEASIKYLVLTNTWRKFAQRAQEGALDVA